MSIEDNKAIVRSFIDEVMNKQDISAIERLFAADFVNHTPQPGVPPTRDGIKAFFSKFLSAFPDLHASINDQVAEESKVMTFINLKGTQKGDFLGVPGTGKYVEINEVFIMHIADAKIAAYWVIFDRLSLMQQMGAIPAPALGR
jgi:steroid delta-isomerase-like uncharacterized protein